jgi:hypothetical protein
MAQLFMIRPAFWFKTFFKSSKFLVFRQNGLVEKASFARMTLCGLLNRWDEAIHNKMNCNRNSAVEYDYNPKQ